MIRFKVIKIKKYILIFVFIALMLTISFKTVRFDKTVPVFAASEKVNVTPDFLKKLDNSSLKKIICWGMPILSRFEMQKSPLFNVKEAMGFISKAITNVDINSPESYISMQIPLVSLMKTQVTITPGTELIPSELMQPENEHVPDKNPLEAPEDNNTNIEKIELEKGKPLILIFHTHTTESYTPSKAYNYKLTDKSYHTEDLNFTVAKVGEVMAEELNKMGMSTIHDKTIHDIPHMTSYTKSLKTVENILKANPSIKIVIDLHRDAPVLEPNKSREITTVMIDGKTYSRMMFVIGTDSVFPHPNWKENYQFATLVNEKLEEKYPGITREIDIRQHRFNQHVSKKAVLLEIGSHGNTMEESIESAKIFADVLQDVVNDLMLNEKQNSGQQ